jgi:hypothetical protein
VALPPNANDAGCLQFVQAKLSQGPLQNEWEQFYAQLAPYAPSLA